MMINLYFFIDENLKIGFKINLENHNINHANSILTITSTFPEVGIEFRYFKKIIKELSVIYARLLINIILNITHYFQGAFIKLTKKIKDLMKLNYYKPKYQS